MDPVSGLLFHEDFSLKLGDSIETICFHPALNVFVVTTKDRKLRVFDSHSAVKLTDVDVNHKKGLLLVYYY